MKEVLSLFMVVLLGCATLEGFSEPAFSYNEDNYTVSVIDEETTKYLCEEATIGEVITVNSEGGLITEAHVSGLCIKDKRIKLVVLKALSAAPLLTMLGTAKSVCLYKKSLIGWHTPYKSRVHRAHTIDSRKGILQVIEPLKAAGYSKDITDRIAGRMIVASPYQMTWQLAEEFKDELGHRFAGYCI
jgi:hypothetical protein